jgi:hypothetical protein
MIQYVYSNRTLPGKHMLLLFWWTKEYVGSSADEVSTIE